MIQFVHEWAALIGWEDSLFLVLDKPISMGEISLMNEPNEAVDIEAESDEKKAEKRVDSKPVVSSKRPVSSTASFFFKGGQNIASSMHRLQKLSRDSIPPTTKRRRRGNCEHKTMAESLDASSNSGLEDEKRPVQIRRNGASSDDSSSAPSPKKNRLFVASPSVELDPELLTLLAKYSVQASTAESTLRHARVSGEQPRAAVHLRHVRERSTDALNIRLHVEHYDGDKASLYTCHLGHTFGEISEAVEKVSATDKITLFFRDAPIISTSSTPASLRMIPGDTIEALSAAAMKGYHVQRQTEQARRAELVEAVILHAMSEERRASDKTDVLKVDATPHASMAVKVRISAKQVESFGADPDMTIKELLKAVAAKLEKPDLHASLVWDGRVLPLTETIESAEIEDGDLLELRIQSVK